MRPCHAADRVEGTSSRLALEGAGASPGELVRRGGAPSARGAAYHAPEGLEGRRRPARLRAEGRVIASVFRAVQPALGSEMETPPNIRRGTRSATQPCPAVRGRGHLGARCRPGGTCASCWTCRETPLPARDSQAAVRVQGRFAALPCPAQAAHPRRRVRSSRCVPWRSSRGT